MNIYHIQKGHDTVFTYGYQGNLKRYFLFRYRAPRTKAGEARLVEIVGGLHGAEGNWRNMLDALRRQRLLRLVPDRHRLLIAANLPLDGSLL